MDTPTDGRPSEAQDRVGEEQTVTQPHIPGEYPRSQHVRIISSRYPVALSIVLVLLALHLQLNRNWPEYYRGISRAVCLPLLFVRQYPLPLTHYALYSPVTMRATMTRQVPGDVPRISSGQLFRKYWRGPHLHMQLASPSIFQSPRRRSVLWPLTGKAPMALSESRRQTNRDRRRWLRLRRSTGSRRRLRT